MLMRVQLKPGERPRVRLAADLLIVAGACGVLVGLWGLSEGAVYQHIQARYFAMELAGKAAGGGFGATEMPSVTEARPQPRVSRRPTRGTSVLTKLFDPDPLIVGRLEVPSVQLSVMVREGVDSETLRKAAGHLPSSALPGDPGNFVVLAHRDTFFRPLRDIARGASIRVRTNRGSFDYEVASIEVVSPEWSLRFGKSSAPEITLVTCFPFGYLGPAPRRFIVRARLIDTKHEGERNEDVNGN